MTVYFHGSFSLHRERMAGLLSSSLGDSSLRDKQLAAPFRYGAPFSARYRSWLHKTGLTRLGFPVRLTELGQVVRHFDPDLQRPTTMWLMHWELTQDPERTEAWHFFANEFLPNHESFTRQDLLDGLATKLSSHSERHFGPGSKLNVVIARKLIDCYIQPEGLGQLKLLRVVGNGFVRDVPNAQRGPWDSISALRDAYS